MRRSTLRLLFVSILLIAAFAPGAIFAGEEEQCGCPYGMRCTGTCEEDCHPTYCIYSCSSCTPLP